VTCEAGVCLGKSRFGYGSALGEGISRDPSGEGSGINLYDYVLNDPINYIDPTGLVFMPPRNTGSSCKRGNCWKNCMMQNGAGWAIAALTLASPAVTIPKPFGAGALGSGSVTTALSIAEALGFGAGRQLGRALNPYADAAAVAAAGFLIGESASCAAICGSDPSSY